jgi:hypothetical protein
LLSEASKELSPRRIEGMFSAELPEAHS